MNRCPKGFKILCPYVEVLQIFGSSDASYLCVGSTNQCSSWRKHADFKFVAEGRFMCKLFDVPCLDATDDDTVCVRPMAECELWCKEKKQLDADKRAKKGRNIEIGDDDE